MFFEKQELNTFVFVGLAVISLCLSLIQEQVGRSAQIALGIKGEVIEMDVVQIIPRKHDFLNSDEPAKSDNDPEGEPVVVVGAIPVSNEQPNIPGEVKETGKIGTYLYEYLWIQIHSLAGKGF